MRQISDCQQRQAAGVGFPTRLTSKYATNVKAAFSYDGNELPSLEDIPQVKKVTRNGRTVEVEGIGSFVSLMAAKLVSHGIVPNDLRTRQPSLEDVFLKLTGHRIEV